MKIKNRFLMILGVSVALATQCFADNGDTTVVQTFKFSDKKGGKIDIFNFPDGSKTYEKVLMYYTLRCDPSAQDGFPCGEWDYDVYTELLLPKTAMSPVVILYDTTYSVADSVLQVDSTNVPFDSTWSYTYDTSYKLRESAYEIWRLGIYITPYGGRIDLGEGWTWIYDVSDFVQLLKDDVILRDGNGSELVDIKFIFIEGTPVRNVVNIKKVWDSRGVSYSGYWEGYPLKFFDNIVKDTTFTLTAQEKQVKLRTTVTGHMYGEGSGCAEFCSNIHTLKVNGQEIRSWDILQDCANNPLKGQAGTWVLPRAGWCTGTEAKTNEFELTPYITNNSINFDYDVQSDPYGVYRMTSYLVTYGDNNITDDAEAAAIMAPTNNPQYSHYNPTCNNPIVVIKNIGANNLQSATITYGIGNEGATQMQKTYTYQWSGNLALFEMDTIQLPRVNFDEIGLDSASKGEFFFEISNPNNVSDPTPHNNKLHSSFVMPHKYNFTSIKIALRTDDHPGETSWELSDIFGNVYGHSELVMNNAKTVYESAPIALTDGCYVLKFSDTYGDGMYGWFRKNGYSVSDIGAVEVTRLFSGTIYTKVTDIVIPYDFGRDYYYYFANGIFSDVKEKTVNPFAIYPNPAKSMLNVAAYQYSGTATAYIYDIQGRLLMTQDIEGETITQIPLHNFAPGFYTVVFKDKESIVGRGKFAVTD
ncbi:MAG: T9SS type A sorting domain-containing protein [Bacteroidales bacterium]|jgi:hypothetical protein|nr:T9SS type A sorting domain-containing protein [Bacteroidales bacterium]